ncbi:MAG: bifunctional oligoribonuclease/PAP phosphatase NrnA [Clostridia bacterium]|nr:bifunctional oligoribonuclease/PAP phosphatase NrnA [Clostridia bacterium]
MILISQLAKNLINEESVAIFLHIRPDGDAIGSGIALSLALKLKGVKADVYCDDEIPLRFSYLNAETLIKKEIDKKYSCYLAVDCADLGRLGGFSELFINNKNTYNIDHHISNGRYAKYNYVVDNASNCENVFELIKEMNVETDSRVATALITGIITDTGNLKHNNVKAETVARLSELVRYGGDLHSVIYYNFSLQSQERALLFGQTMSKIKYYYDGRLAMATVFKEDLERTNAKPYETEGFIDFIMGINGVKVGVCIMELEKNKFKASLRGNDTDVNAIANVFGGGGHILAAGCQYKGDYNEFLDKLLYAVKQHLAD